MIWTHWLNFMAGLTTTCWQQSSNCNKIAVVDVTENLIRSQNLTPTQFVCNHYIVLSSLPLFSLTVTSYFHTLSLYSRVCDIIVEKVFFTIFFLFILSCEEMEVRIEMKSKLKLLYNMKKRQELCHYKREIRESLTGAEWENVVIFARRRSRKIMGKVRDGNLRLLTM